jgi:hypothetical protein
MIKQLWSDPNMHLAPADFTSFIKKIQKNVGVQKTEKF